MSRLLSVLAVLGFGILHISLGWRFIQISSPTYDEGLHLASGYSYLKTGRYRLNIYDHPPLAEMWAALALPSSLDTYFSHPYWLEGRKYHYADLFLYHNRLPADILLNRGRIFCFVTWTLFLLFWLVLWSVE
ncbi:MAG: hypothetical protein HY400_03675, partial [Elusimicrobia bacterium]|nr:hypothetical protein [Elusimicrobiota bacterium]